MSIFIRELEKSSPYNDVILFIKEVFLGVLKIIFLSLINLKVIFLFKRAILFIRFVILFPSEMSEPKNFFLTGRLKNKSLTIIVVPVIQPTSFFEIISLFLYRILIPDWSSSSLVVISTLDTELILAKASPLNPKEFK